jgi:hypothetical protein
MPAVESAAAWRTYAEGLRRDLLDGVVFRGARAREWREAKTRVLWHDPEPGMWIPAVLYRPDNLSGRVPVHLAVNGHDREGKAAGYKQLRCINLAKRGVISLNIEWFYMGELRREPFKHYAMNQLDLCGVSGLAPFYLSMSRGLDLLLALPAADPERVAVSGLSGGGWQTIFFSALDPRVTLANPVAGYSSLRTWTAVGDIGDSEQSPNDFATLADYTHLTALLAGRATLLTYNARDTCCFVAEHALEPLVQAAAPVFALLGEPSRLRTHVNYEPGTHNFERDNREALYRIVGDEFFPHDAGWRNEEFPSDGEIRMNTALEADLPADNLSLNDLARTAARELPRDPGRVLRDPSGARARLREIVHHRPTRAEALLLAATPPSEPELRLWRLRLGGDWTVPVAEFGRGPAGPRC